MAMNVPVWQGRKFGPAASTISLSDGGGAILGGIWVSAKGTSPTIVVYEASASAATALLVPSFIPAAVGDCNIGPIACKSGLCVKIASVSGVIKFMPSSY